MSVTDSPSILESLNSQLVSMQAEMRELRSAFDSRGAAGMEEDRSIEVEEEDDSSEFLGQQWATVLGIATVEPTKPASLSLASLLTAHPPLEQV